MPCEFGLLLTARSGVSHRLCSIAEKRLGDWIQAIILWVHDQCGAMARMEFCVLDKTEEMVHGVYVLTGLERTA